jgi:hypothetical protein
VVVAPHGGGGGVIWLRETEGTRGMEGVSGEGDVTNMVAVGLGS